MADRLKLLRSLRFGVAVEFRSVNRIGSEVGLMAISMGNGDDDGDRNEGTLKELLTRQEFGRDRGVHRDPGVCPLAPEGSQLCRGM